MTKRARILLLSLAAIWLAAVRPPLRASCESPTHFESGYITTGLGFFPVTSLDITGVFWARGFGDPEVGEGIDNGGYPSGPLIDGRIECAYGQGCWIYADPAEWDYYGPSMLGTWHHPRVDGCVRDVPGPACMAALLTDQRDGVGFFGLLTAVEDGLDNFFFSSQVTLVPIPAPQIASTSGSVGLLTIDLLATRVPTSGLIPSRPGPCNTGLIEGFKIYQQVVAPGGAPPRDARRDDGVPLTGWEPALGGTGAAGTPLPDGATARLSAIDCVDGGRVYLATSFVFEAGFETAHVSAISAAIPCGACSALDGDGDGARADKCAPRASFDCDDAQAGTFPGAPQVCDGANNDCRHPRWPSLADTNEADQDGDGVTACAGDLCPLDAQDDADADGLCADVDNCPAESNPGQEDGEQDGQGDACDPCPASAFDDRDGDGLCGNVDNCPQHSNPGQQDLDGDGLGDPCDTCPLDRDNDLDGDGICGNVDSCPVDTYNDVDHDGICGDVDTCPYDRDNDIDGDTWCAELDNCPLDANKGQEDVDQDDLGDACDLFAPAVDIRLGTSVDSIAVADFDGDRDVDVVTSRLQWHRNLNGDGSAWQLYPVGIPPNIGLLSHGVAAAEVTGDGLADVLHSGTSITLYENRGVGSSWIPRPVRTLQCGAAMAPADLDGDGDTDVALAAYCEHAVLWLENTASNGTAWTTRMLGSFPGVETVAAGDIDGDGDLDLFAGGTQQGPFPTVFRLYRNIVGDATSWSAATIQDHLDEGRPSGLSPADADSDGDLDLFVSTWFGTAPGVEGGLSWHENLDGAGETWQRHHLDNSGSGYKRVAAADVDGDGDTDVFGMAFSPGLVSWHQNADGHWKLWVRRQIASAGSLPKDMVATDLDGDLDADLVLGTYQPFDVEWHENVRFNPPLPFDPGAAPQPRGPRQLGGVDPWARAPRAP